METLSKLRVYVIFVIYCSRKNSISLTLSSTLRFLAVSLRLVSM